MALSILAHISTTSHTAAATPAGATGARIGLFFIKELIWLIGVVVVVVVVVIIEIVIIVIVIGIGIPNVIVVVW